MKNKSDKKCAKLEAISRPCNRTESKMWSLTVIPVITGAHKAVPKNKQISFNNWSLKTKWEPIRQQQYQNRIEY